MNMHFDVCVSNKFLYEYIKIHIHTNKPDLHNFKRINKINIIEK